MAAPEEKGKGLLALPRLPDEWLEEEGDLLFRVRPRGCPQPRLLLLWLLLRLRPRCRLPRELLLLLLLCLHLPCLVLRCLPPCL